MTISAFENDHSAAKGVSRRTLVKGAAWSVPVVAAAVAMPLAAASTAVATLTYGVAPIVDVDAPFGAVSIRISNTSTAGYSGPLTFTTPEWSTVAAFSLAGVAPTSVDGNAVWKIPAASVPAGASIVLHLSWTGPFPPAVEEQPVTVTVDQAAATITPAGSTTLASPYQLLWYAVTPGGEGTVTGTQSFFIGNTTETAFDGTVDAFTNVWPFPLSSFRALVIEGQTYTGGRAVVGGKIVAVYRGLPTSVSARSGKQLFMYPPGATSSVQQSIQLLSITPNPAARFAVLGDLTMYTPYRPAAG